MHIPRRRHEDRACWYGSENADFTAVAEDLGASLDAAKMSEREKKELLSILAKMRRDIVEK
jgi:hypothetical protein